LLKHVPLVVNTFTEDFTLLVGIARYGDENQAILWRAVGGVNGGGGEKCEQHDQTECSRY
jgi:hypothetical protein